MFCYMGLHVSKGKKKSIGVAIESEQKDKKIKCAQIFTHGPRGKQAIAMDAKEFKTIDIPVYVHASYATKLVVDGLPHIIQQLNAASAIGAAGLVVHLPTTSPAVVAYVCDLLNKSFTNGIPVPILLELCAMKPSDVSYETPTKLKALVASLDEYKLDAKKFGICIDTAHLFSCGMKISTPDEMKTYLSGLSDIVGRVKLIHFNGNKSKTYRDTHVLPGDNADLIWGRLGLEKSGAKVLYNWATTNKISMVIEPGSTNTQSTVDAWWKNNM